MERFVKEAFQQFTLILRALLFDKMKKYILFHIIKWLVIFVETEFDQKI
jgi:hypothetical protein